MYSTASSVLALTSVVLASCAIAPPPAPPLPIPPIVRFEAVLEPGCLLPHPETMRRSAIKVVTAVVQVSATGTVSGASLKSSTGDVELDAALREAVMRCRFTPAYDAGGRPFVRTEVAHTQELRVVLPSLPGLTGPHRCLQPEYPHAARRADETGRVRVAFRKRSGDNRIEVNVIDGSSPLRVLRPLSASAVTQCLQHESVISELPADKWHVVDYVWRLE